MFQSMGFGMGFGWIFWAIIIAVFSYLILKIFRGQTYPGLPENRETPLEILKKRYARGEISKEEFDSMKNNIV